MRYVAFEGIDGAGKSTIIQRVADALVLDDIAIQLVREPGGTPVGEAVRQTLLHAGDDMSLRTEALLFAAARTQLVHEVIIPAIEEGRLVLSDRSAWSSLAYQGGARELGVEEVRAPNAWGLQGVWPDLVILLELDPEVGLSREDGPDRISSEGFSLMRRVADTYAELAKASPNLFVRIDAAEPVDDVVSACLQAIRDRL